MLDSACRLRGDASIAGDPLRPCPRAMDGDDMVPEVAVPVVAHISSKPVKVKKKVGVSSDMKTQVDEFIDDLPMVHPALRIDIVKLSRTAQLWGKQPWVDYKVSIRLFAIIDRNN